MGAGRFAGRPQASTPNPFPILTTTGFYFGFADAVKYQDVAASSPVTTTGQSVGFVEDQGLYGLDASAVLSGARPTWNATAGSINFTGSTDHLLHVPGLIPAEDGTSLMARFRGNVAVAGTQVLIGSASLTNRAWISLTTGVASMGVGGNGSDATKDPGGTDLRSATVWHTIAGVWDATDYELYVDGVSVLSGTRAAGTVSPFAVSIGKRNTTSGGTAGDNHLTGEISHALGIRRRITDSEVAELHALWMS